ncbi:MAG: CAP domain-containing protein, partial [Chloroflexota bacterium]
MILRHTLAALVLVIPLVTTAMAPVPRAAAPRLSDAPPAPALTVPAAGATVSPGFTLAWTNPPGAPQVQVQLIPINNDGPGIDLQLGSAATQLEVPAPPGWYGLLPDMSYTWRVRASNAASFVGAGDLSWSPWAQRSFRSAKVDGRLIVAKTPAEGATLDSLTPTVVWEDPTPGVFYYEVRLSKDQTFNTNPATATAMIYSALLHGALTQPPRSYAVPVSAALEAGTTYYWQVRPRVQGDGAPLAWGDLHSFRTAAAGGPPPVDAKPWLARVNQFRALAGLPPVTENSEWSDGCQKHARYMATNDFIGHTETEGAPGFTPEGLACAQKGNVFVSSNPNTPETRSIDAWITGPFHALGIIDPKLRQVAFGAATDEAGPFRYGAALDVLRGLDSRVSPTYPVRFPGDGGAMPLRLYDGAESPDPLTSCPGYTAPTGPPIILQLGSFAFVP